MLNFIKIFSEYVGSLMKFNQSISKKYYGNHRYQTCLCSINIIKSTPCEIFGNLKRHLHKQSSQQICNVHRGIATMLLNTILSILHLYTHTHLFEQPERIWKYNNLIPNRRNLLRNFINMARTRTNCENRTSK